MLFSQVLWQSFDLASIFPFTDCSLHAIVDRYLIAGAEDKALTRCGVVMCISGYYQDCCCTLQVYCHTPVVSPCITRGFHRMQQWQRKH